MADFTSETAAEVLATCQEGADEAAGAFGRGLDGEFSFEVGEATTLTADAAPESWHGPGLVITFHIAESGALLLLPESSNLLPDWYAEPDDTGKSKLATLAQELGYVLLPEDFTPDDASASRVKDLAAAFQRSQSGEEVACLPLKLTRDDQSGEASLIWPMQAIGEALAEADEESTSEATADEPEETAEAEATAEESEATETEPSTEETEVAEAEAPEPEPQPATPPKRRIQYADIDDGISQLPTYAKSLLKVRVPVTVTLASAKHPVNQILELGPGSIIQFDKSCEDTLTLEVGNHPIAEGEAVKVGEKFGLWVTAMTMPDERFWVIHGKRSGARVK